MRLTAATETLRPHLRARLFSDRLRRGWLFDRLAQHHYQLAILEAANSVNIPSGSTGQRLPGLFAYQDQIIALKAVVAFFEVKTCRAVANVRGQFVVDRVHAKHRKLAQVVKAIARGVIQPVLGLCVGRPFLGHKYQVQPAVKIDILSSEKEGFILGEWRHRKNVQLLYDVSPALKDNGLHYTPLRNRLQFEAKVGRRSPVMKNDAARIAACYILRSPVRYRDECL